MGGTDHIPEDLETAGALMLGALNGLAWLDESLQNYIRSRGWPSVTRPQSMVMATIEMGLNQPSDIARRLGVSRQAIHNTLKSMIELDMIELADDPINKRVKIVRLTVTGEAMRKDARAAMRIMLNTLNERLGSRQVAQATDLLSRNWGPTLTFSSDESLQGD